ETFVDFEVGLNSAVRKLRESLDDSADNPRFVETVPRRGYRFVASVTAAAADRAPSDPPAERIPVPMPAMPAEQTLAPMPGTPRSRLIGWRAALLLLVVLIGTAGAVYKRGGLTRLRPGSSAAEPIRSLIVLPFENLTGDPGQDYFAASVTDAVTAHLAQVGGLDVISSTSARQYKQADKRIPEMGAELKVEGVVEGTVSRSGARVGITVKLIRAATDRNEWAKIYEEDVSHMFTLQQRLASDLAVAAGQRQLARRTPQATDPKAYDAYAKGLTAQGQQRYEGFRRAVAYFEEAVAIQPDFAEAHAQLAHTQLQFLFGGPLSPHESIPKAEAAARRALQLDETLARAHTALGQILILYHWRVEEGDKALDRATELKGGGDEFSSAITNSLIRRGRPEEAIAVAERGRKLDPLSVGTQVAVGIAYRAAGQYDRAINELRRALEMSPAHPRVHFQLGVTFVTMGRYADAIRELEIAARPAPSHNSRVEAYLGYAYAAAERIEDARAVLKELEAHRREQYVSSFGIALIHDALGEKEPALAALRRAHQDHAVEFAFMAQYPRFKAIASEPGFEAVMRQVGSDATSR
ncbi:MAG TPA: tetratricopeptide repeat protein, partial [Gemmatimonadaceae bacterium]|nr:tetratricopeptide repeat protein [Gemmatimonadaceae bacterium]